MADGSKMRSLSKLSATILYYWKSLNFASFGEVNNNSWPWIVKYGGYGVFISLSVEFCSLLSVFLKNLDLSHFLVIICLSPKTIFQEVDLKRIIEKWSIWNTRLLIITSDLWLTANLIINIHVNLPCSRRIQLIQW